MGILRIWGSAGTFLSKTVDVWDMTTIALGNTFSSDRNLTVSELPKNVRAFPIMDQMNIASIAFE
jgi:hypothetical protein